MNRYFFNLSYIGTGFRGVQKQTNAKLIGVEDPVTIQGQVEIGLKKLRPSFMSSCCTSSRTDAGVHALHTTMHVDMQNSRNEPYEPRIITHVLNKRFQKLEIPIRIINTFIVPNTFHCRKNALHRMYLYKIAVLKNDEMNLNMLSRHIPIENFNRMLFLRANSFDVDKFREACNLFIGLHDFRTFMHRASFAPDKITRKTIQQLEIVEVDHKCYTDYSWPRCINDKLSDYKFYDIYCKGNSFLYKQVRRTVAALIAVAQGKVTTRDIKFMLEVPSHNSWDPRIKTVPAHGLYLCEVAYSDSDYQTFKATLEK